MCFCMAQHPTTVLRTDDDEPATSTQYDVFLSYSGVHRAFAKDIYQVLTSHGFRAFLDVQDGAAEALPQLLSADAFVQRIVAAASSCKLALVVLSLEYVSCKWPMLELCGLVRASPAVKILPVFLHLSPSDLHKEIISNLDEWGKEWHHFPELDPSDNIDVSECKKALNFACSDQSGLIYLGGQESEGQQCFIKRVVDSISGASSSSE